MLIFKIFAEMQRTLSRLATNLFHRRALSLRSRWSLPRILIYCTKNHLIAYVFQWANVVEHVQKNLEYVHLPTWKPDTWLPVDLMILRPLLRCTIVPSTCILFASFIKLRNRFKECKWCLGESIIADQKCTAVMDVVGRKLCFLATRAIHGSMYMIVPRKEFCFTSFLSTSMIHEVMSQNYIFFLRFMKIL